MKLLLKLIKKSKNFNKLLSFILLSNLFIIGLTVGFNKFRAFFISSFEHHSYTDFSKAMIMFCVLAFFYVITTGYNAYWRRILAFNSRESLYLGLGKTFKYKKCESLLPEQRFTQDLDELTNLSIEIINGIFNSVIKLPIFIYLLAQIAPFWVILAILIWVVIGHLLANRISKPLIKLNYEQETREAVLRRDMLKVKTIVFPSMRDVKLNWSTLAHRTKMLQFFQSGFIQISIVLPYLLLSPMFFQGLITLGVLWSAADAFKTVLECLEYLIEKRDEVAKLQSVYKRVKEIL